jgi:predicted Zn-dependent peptidase
MATQQYAVQIKNGPAAADDDRYAGRVLTTILGDDVGSRLFWELVDPGLAEYAAMVSYEFQGTGIMMTCVACSPERMAGNLQVVLGLEREIERDGVAESELEQAKNKIASHIVLQSERSASRLFAVGNNWIQRGGYRSVQEVVRAYRAVTRDSIGAVVDKYPLTENTTVVIGPLAEVPAPAV